MRIIVLLAALAAGAAELRAGNDPNPPAEERVPVDLRIRGVGHTELFVLRREKKIFLPLNQVLNFLQINAQISSDRSSVSGFFISTDTTYLVDTKAARAEIKGRTIPLGTDQYVVTNEDLYLESNVLRDLFGIDVTFDPHRLTVTLKSTRALPVELAYERTRNRERSLRLHEQPPAGLEMGRAPLGFGGTRLDYRFGSSIFQEGPPRHTYQVGFGGHAIGGDFEVRALGDVGKRLRENNVNAFIRYPFFDTKAIQQIVIGDVADRDPLFASRVRGLQITNQPAARRLILGTEPLGVEVPSANEIELYEGGVLKSYVKTPHDSLYNLQLDMPYGISDFEVRAYDPWGGVTSSRYRYNIPQILIPPREFQYNLLGGQLRNFGKQSYGKASAEFGASEHLTVGGELIYLAPSGESGSLYPGITTTARLFGGVTGQFTFSPLIASQFILNALFPSQAFFTFTNTRFKNTSPFNISGVVDENTFSGNLPIYFGDRSIYLTLQADQTRFANQRSQNLSGGFAGYSGSFRYDLTTNLGWTRFDQQENQRSIWTTQGDISFRMPSDVVMALSALYDHQLDQLQDFTAILNRPITTDILVTLSYTHTFTPSFTFARLQLTYDLPFMRFEGRGIKTNFQYEYDQILSGSIVTSASLRDFLFEDRLRLGRAALEFRPFLDENSNGVKDASEHYLPTVIVKTYGPKLTALAEKTSSGLTIENAEAYQHYIGYFPSQTFEDPHWVPKYPSFSLMAEPNIIRSVEMPVVVGGLVSGRVLEAVKGAETPVEGVTVTIENQFYKKTMMTFSTGEYNFIGVPPGAYTISLLQTELQSAGFTTTELSKSVEVHAKPEGDVIENVDFKLTPK